MKRKKICEDCGGDRNWMSKKYCWNCYLKHLKNTPRWNKGLTLVEMIGKKKAIKRIKVASKFRKGKTYEEMYGVKKAKEIKAKKYKANKGRNKGKTIEEIYGKTKAQKKLRDYRKTRKQKVLDGWVSPRKGKSFEVQFGKKRAKIILRKITSTFKKGKVPHNKDKTWEEMYGVKKAKERKTIYSKRTTKQLKEYPRNYENRKASNRCSPNKTEQIVIKYTTEEDLPYRYVGNGGIWITLEGIHINPDFISTRDKKVFVEILGCYWHGCRKCCRLYKYSGAQHRAILKIIKRDKLKRRLLKKYGYKVLYIWEHDVKNRKFRKMLENL